jgi:hypothetical protein
MAEVIPFPRRAEPPPAQIDVLSAVDFAIRDLRDIARRSTCAWTREKADECQLMLQQAFDAELG